MSSPRAVSHLVEAVRDRSGGRCEAVWHTGYRCPNRADEIHHRLPRGRSRVGDEHPLDVWALTGDGDVDHLADLCRPCHHAAEADPTRAYEGCLSGPFGSTAPRDLRIGIVVPGTITRVRHRTDLGAWVPRYIGPDPTFTAAYPGDPDR